MTKISTKRVAMTLLATLSVAASLSGCIPLLVGGAAVGSAFVVTDRRTSGTQLDDEGIELRANSALRESTAEPAHVSVTSYNRRVLLTGEVPTAQDKQLVEQLVSRVGNVGSVVNELEVRWNASLTERSSDALITGKVKASFVDARDLYANAFKVVTVRGTVYLMGRVTQREADRATEITRGVSGVQRVVRILEIVSEQDLQQAVPQPSK